MDFGASIFFTDYSITPAELGVAMEERGFDSVWAAEHSHIPVPRRTRAGRCELRQALLRRDGPVRDADRRGLRHQEAQDRDRHRAGNPARHDPDREARRLDRSGVGRAVHVRHRRRLEPGGDREPRHRLRDAHAEDARADRGDEGDLDQAEAGISRRDRRVRHDDDLAEAGAEAVSADHSRRRLPVGGAARGALRRRLVSERVERRPEQYIPAFREMAQEAGRDPQSLSLRLGGAPDDLDKLKRYRDMGVDAVNVTLMSDKRDEILPVLDRWAGYIRQLRG